MDHPTAAGELLVEVLEQDFLSLVPNKERLWPDLERTLRKIGHVSLTLYSTSTTLIPFPAEADVCSIIVPTYNVEDYIDATLRSIVTQDYPFFEICIVDDGSSDGTAERVLAFMQSMRNTVRMRFLKAPHIGNPSLVRNIGIAVLADRRSCYLGFMDGDDLYAREDALSLLAKTLQSDVEAIAAYGDYDWVSDNGKTLAPAAGLHTDSQGNLDWRPGHRLCWENLASGRIGVFHLQCLMVRRETAPFLSYRRVGEDAEYYAQLFVISAKRSDGSLAGIRQIPVVIAHYRKRTTSISQAGDVPGWHEPPHLYPFERRRIGATLIPFFLDMAGVPDRYITRQAISEYELRRSARLIFRNLRRHGAKAAFRQLVSLLKHPLVRWSSIPSVVLKELLQNRAVTSGALESIRAYLRARST